jgi:predicted TIM-barrel fold metal-dependent hydrolase
MVRLAEEVRVVDADTHMTEPMDLWTKRAPRGYEDRLPRVEEVDGRPMWVLDGKPFGFAGGGSTIDPKGKKHPFAESQPVWRREQAHRAAYDPQARLDMMDEFGIYAQVIYPNSVGLGGQNLNSTVGDDKLKQLCVEIYNDSLAELQEWSKTRLLPMPIMPAWSIEACVHEAERVARLGLRGINLTSDPQDLGSPDLASKAWDPLWEVCADLALPVHFHIGASLTSAAFYGQYFWASQHDYVKPGIGGALHFINNARLVINTIYAGIFDRHPRLKMVSVESGIGWIPFMLETMDWEIWENSPQQAAELSQNPSEYVKDHWYATLWFENNFGDLQGLVERVGEDNVLFETDFPHPTCIYPDPVGFVEERMSTLRPETRRKVMGDNASTLYKL